MVTLPFDACAAGATPSPMPVATAAEVTSTRARRDCKMCIVVLRSLENLDFHAPPERVTSGSGQRSPDGGVGHVRTGNRTSRVSQGLATVLTGDDQPGSGRSGSSRLTAPPRS